MRSIRMLAVAAVAALGPVAYATAQSSSTTVFSVGGTVTVQGGSRARPKPGGLSFRFDVSDPSGLQTPPVQTYTIMYEGGRLNTTLLPACTARQINAPNLPTVAGCPAGSRIGQGRLSALIGAAGQPVASASPCQASLQLFNAGRGHATLFVSSQLATCPVALGLGIDMQYVTSGDAAGLKFTVPDMLRHQAGLDITVTHAEATLNRIVVRRAGRRVGYIESTGCSGDRTLTVTFTDETGAAFPASASVGPC